METNYRIFGVLPACLQGGGRFTVSRQSFIDQNGRIEYKDEKNENDVSNLFIL